MATPEKQPSRLVFLMSLRSKPFMSSFDNEIIYALESAGSARKLASTSTQK